MFLFLRKMTKRNDKKKKKTKKKRKIKKKKKTNLKNRRQFLICDINFSLNVFISGTGPYLVTQLVQYVYLTFVTASKQRSNVEKKTSFQR